jgi:hypothetical protein
MAKGGGGSKSEHRVNLGARVLRQGLADEEYELEDEDEEEPLDEDEEPLLVNRAHNHTNGQASLPSYGYRDLFGKEMEARRRQIIDVKVGRAPAPGCWPAERG